MGGRRGAYRVLVKKPEGKRQLYRTRRKWEGNIRKDLQKFNGNCVEYIVLTQYSDNFRASVNTLMKIRVTENTGDSLTT
jgi:hypothetical protein